MKEIERAAEALDPAELAGQRLGRLRRTMAQLDVPWLLTADPINIAYATGLRNMSIFSMMGATRFLLVSAEGPVVAWEFGGSEHLVAGVPLIDEVRTAPGVTAHRTDEHLPILRPFARCLMGTFPDGGPAAA